MSAQLAIDFTRPAVGVPKPGSQHYTLLMAMKRGERLRPLESANKYGVMALSQRIGELKRMGWPVLTQMVDTPAGKRIAEYWMD